MNKLTTRILIILICCSTTSGIRANTPPEKEDSITFSLITCAPGGEAIYSLFGHTAIRYQDKVNRTDIVFNYGLFSFNTPNFIWRFVKGETDYALGAPPFNVFIKEYIYYNRKVHEQELNLQPEEKLKLLELLTINAQPQNRIYRYNFFFDNCSTRPRDIIEASIQGKVIYQEINDRYTFRDIMHQSTVGYDWSRFGMDFCLGIDADKPITYREEMFSPIYLIKAFEQAQIVDNNNTTRPLVSHESVLFNPQENCLSGSYLITPIRAFLLLFVFIVGATIYGIKRKKSLWWLDILLFASAGIAGCITALLTFFSEHPTVSPNYLIFAFHPLHLLLMPFFVYKEYKGRRSIYHLTNSIVLTLFILLWPVIPQYFNPAVLPLALCLLIRSLNNLLLTYKQKR